MGGSKTTVSSSGTSKQTQKIPKEIRQRGSQITQGAMNTYFDPSKKYEHFDYGTYQKEGEGMTGQLNQYHNQAGQNLGNASGAYQNATQSQIDTLTGSRDANQAGKYQGQEYTDENIAKFQNPYEQQVRDKGVREIRDAMNQQRLQNQSRAAQAGAFGGARHGVIDAETQASGAQALSDFIGQHNYQGFQNAQNQFNTQFNQGLQQQNQQNQAAAQNYGMDQNIAQAMQAGGQQDFANQMALAQGNTNLGNIYTQQDQAQKDNAYKAYQNKQEKPMEMYERLAAINAMQPHNRTTVGTTTGTSTQSSSGGWLGPALGAAGNIAASFSDETAKENIKDLDPEKTLSAFAAVPPKSYTYKDEVVDEYPDLARGGLRRGFTAQDYNRAFGRKDGARVGGYQTVDHAQIIGDLVNAVHGLEKRTRKLKRK